MSSQITAQSEFEGLRARLRGQLVLPGDASYDESRKVWNGDIDRRPAAIARATCVEDVQAAVGFARESGIPLSIRAGGHSLPGHCIADDALLLDLRAMNRVTIDPAARLATVQGGATWAEVDGPAQALGLAVTGGHVTHTGVAGLTLGGGVGHLMRKLGLTIDNLVSVEVVTADGQVRRASATENPDLFWAVRGGGGNFGVATEFVLRLTPVGPMVWGGIAFWRPAQGPALLRRWRDWCRTAPDEVTTLLAYLHAPPFDVIPAEAHFQPGYALIVCGTDAAVAEASLAGLRAAEAPWFDLLGPIPYLAIQSLIDPALPHGTPTYFKSHLIAELPDAALDAVHARTPHMPPGRSQIILGQMGGAVLRVPEDATAFGGRQAGFQSLIIGIWEEPAGREGAVRWVRDLWGALEPYGQGAYVNLTVDTFDEAALERTYGAAKLARLRQVKRRYDPENLFRLNQNIRPA